jgi:hypothetical protein
MTESEQRQSMERILFRTRLSKLLAAPMDPMYTFSSINWGSLSTCENRWVASDLRG